MYPLNMSNGVGFAVANTEDEHKALSEHGYGPKWEPAPVIGQTEPQPEAEPVKRGPGRPKKAE